MAEQQNTKQIQQNQKPNQNNMKQENNQQKPMVPRPTVSQKQVNVKPNNMKQNQQQRPMNQKPTQNVHKQQPRTNSPNTIFVGQKPSMAYAVGVLTQFSNGQNEVSVRARGNSISKAVDVAEIVRRKLVREARISDIEIGTEEMQMENGQKRNVSTICVKLAK